MANASNGDQTGSTRSNRTDRDGQSRVVEDGGVDQTTVPYRRVQQSVRDLLQSFTQNRREEIDSLDRFQLLLGCLFGIGVLGTLAGLANVVSPAVLAPLGAGLLFLTYLLLAVILLRQLTTDQEPPSRSWSDQNRDPVKRRP